MKDYSALLTKKKSKMRMDELFTYKEIVFTTPLDTKKYATALPFH